MRGLSASGAGCGHRFKPGYNSFQMGSLLSAFLYMALEMAIHFWNIQRVILHLLPYLNRVHPLHLYNHIIVNCNLFEWAPVNFLRGCKPLFIVLCWMQPRRRRRCCGCGLLLMMGISRPRFRPWNPLDVSEPKEDWRGALNPLAASTFLTIYIADPSRSRWSLTVSINFYTPLKRRRN